MNNPFVSSALAVMTEQNNPAISASIEMEPDNFVEFMTICGLVGLSGFIGSGVVDDAVVGFESCAPSRRDGWLRMVIIISAVSVCTAVDPLGPVA